MPLPLPLHTLLSIARISATLAYLMLAYHLARTSRILSLPFLFWYAVGMAAHTAWSPTLIRQDIWAEPWLLLLRLCVTVEALCLASGRFELTHRRYLLLCVLAAGMAYGTLVVDFYPVRDYRDIVNVYRAVRLTVHVVLAGMCVAGLAYWARHELYKREAEDGWDRWDREWLPHLSLIGVYMTLRAVRGLGIVTVGHGPEYHHIVRIGYLITACAWVIMWLWYDSRGMREMRASRAGCVNRFKVTHTGA